VEHKSYFQDFLNDVVNIDQKRLDSLDTSIEAIKKHLLDSDYGAKIRFFRPQGSLAHNTIIKPLPGQEFDADLVMVVSENDDWDPKDYLYDLRRVFRKSNTYRDKARLSDVCLTLDYSGDKKLDILPIFEVKDDDDKLHICHHRHNQLIRSEPLEFTSWLVERNKVSGDNSFRKVTRILKYIRNYKTSFTCPSVLMTTIVGEQINENDKGSDAFSSVPKTLSTILNRLDNYLSKHDEVPEVINPSYDDEDLGELWTQSQFENFKRCISKYSIWANEALEEEGHNESLEKWRKLLGEEFGSGKEKGEKALNVLVDQQSEVRALPLAPDAGHPDSFVEAVIKFGVSLLTRSFYSPPHLLAPSWHHSGEEALCTISATYHESGKRVGSGVHVPDGAPLPAHGALHFTCLPFRLSLPTSQYFVQWRITNTGFVAKMKGQMRGDFYLQDGDFSKWESLSYRGVHFVEAFVIRRSDMRIAAQSNPFHVVIK
jgi:hypothetical protein